ncbi:DUF397 domain-containing protein [Streptomyces acidiscabies]|uniref:DUF397 domain-containing protein n=1 Tax=Streptomyces acidiscabies TaxID=42234 RepID=A0AAP6B7E4_9ACTN|nr:DUF397 domain-containing protein [Streptomyces acidiscabies]MBP5939381.1 DUF397 domain-containing protein [Streptomyces sp. LBUM 1476]MBZ3910521.1 DUF397 domain-containing protein [Streptomyces acidiscabies]MDX2959521.1 DUF397 domain-containing protein [Streptomyces acidiscabies]MDX3019191.1 DUF397 domain-containing protein [Streptomyces acidiscabies]MDX3790728.1 DUF397 domain-containing protein [Streptomyces acidiscabies]
MSVGPQPAPIWFKSSYSGSGTSECVECADTGHGTLLRDSKRADGGVIPVRGPAWHSFITALRQEEPRR